MKKLINFKRVTLHLLLLLVFILATTAGWAQQRTITGTVTTNNDNPLPGATVVVKGTTIGTIKDGTGTFSLNLPGNSQELQVSFIGMRSKDVNVEGLSTVTIAMEEDVIGLDEVVAIGYGVAKKADLTGPSLHT